MSVSQIQRRFSTREYLPPRMCNAHSVFHRAAAALRLAHLSRRKRDPVRFVSACGSARWVSLSAAIPCGYAEYASKATVIAMPAQPSLRPLRSLAPRLSAVRSEAGRFARFGVSAPAALRGLSRFRPPPDAAAATPSALGGELQRLPVAGSLTLRGGSGRCILEFIRIARRGSRAASACLPAAQDARAPLSW